MFVGTFMGMVKVPFLGTITTLVVSSGLPLGAW